MTLLLNDSNFMNKYYYLAQFFTTVNNKLQMQYLSNAEIIAIIRTRPGGLTTFLAELTTLQLERGIQEAERLSDLRYRQQHEHFFKKNVLDYSIPDIIACCRDERILLPSEYSIQNSRPNIHVHHRLGLRLVSTFPQKYFVGNKSSHQTRARQLERLYGVIDLQNYYGQNQSEQDQHSSDNQEEANDQSDQQQQQKQQNNNNQQEMNKKDMNEEQDQEQIQNQDQIEQKLEKQFQVDDDFVQQMSEDELDKVLRIRKNNKKIQKQNRKNNQQQKKSKVSSKLQQKVQQKLIQSDEDLNLQQYFLRLNGQLQKQNQQHKENQKQPEVRQKINRIEYKIEPKKQKTSHKRSNRKGQNKKS